MEEAGGWEERARRKLGLRAQSQAPTHLELQLRASDSRVQSCAVWKSPVSGKGVAELELRITFPVIRAVAQLAQPAGV